jgi:ribosomal-protein-alanine N-acetyltransferase
MIDIKYMERSHIDGMVEVEEQCFNSGYARKTFEKELENKIAVYLVALAKEKVVGYTGIWNMCGTADIIDVAVHRDFRRQGIGQKLILAMLDECKKQGVFEVNLEVRLSNLAAQGLYKKLGFAEVGLRKKYYQNTEDAVLMQKVFKEEGVI